MSTPRLCFVFWLLISLNTASTYAQQWSSYRGPNGDGTTTTNASLTGNLKIHWKAPISLGFSSFAISANKAVTIVARNGREVCIAMDARNGETIWESELGSNQYDGGGGAGASGNKGGDGPRSTPTIDGNRVYVYDAQMKLSCLDLETGNEDWVRDILNEFGGRNLRWQNAISPVVNETSVFVAGGGEGMSMLAFDKASGDLAWQKGNELMTHATPVLHTSDEGSEIVFFMQSGMIALDPESGEEIWQNQFPFSVSTAASPVFLKNHVFGSAGYGVGAKLFRLDGDKATLVWEKPNRLINHWSTPVLYNDHLFGMFSFKKYGRGPLQCVDPMAGEVKWSKPGFGPGNCIVVNDKVVALSDSGELVIAEANPESYVELSRHKVLKGKCWSMPAFHDGKLYLRSTDESVCLSFE